MALRNAITSGFRLAEEGIKQQQEFLASLPRKELRKTLQSVLANQQRVHFHILPGIKTVSVYVYIHDLHSFKSAKLVRLLERLEDNGFAVEGTSDWMGGKPNRDFTYSKTIGTAKLDLRVCAYVRADSKSCRIEVVDVKEELVKTEVKRIVCA